MKALLIIILLGLYFLPTGVAFAREHQARFRILVVNILVGWTVLGWIAVGFWAFCRAAEGPAEASTQSQSSDHSAVGTGREGSFEEKFTAKSQGGLPPRCEFCGIELHQKMFRERAWRQGFLDYGACPDCYLIYVLNGGELR